MMKNILMVAALLSATIACNTPPDKTGNIRLENDADMVAYGKNLFGKYCQKCHGENGASMMGNIPNLTTTKLETEEDISNLIFHGRGNMPAFEEVIGEPEIRAISLFVLSNKK
jgi:mono/diheme cytochrome c family protein